MELPPDLFQTCLSPTDSSTSVRFQAAIAKAAGAMHVVMRSVCGERPFEEILHRECAKLAADMKTDKASTSALLDVSADDDDDD